MPRAAANQLYARHTGPGHTQTVNHVIKPQRKLGIGKQKIINTPDLGVTQSLGSQQFLHDQLFWRAVAMDCSNPLGSEQRRTSETNDSLLQNHK